MQSSRRERRRRATNYKKYVAIRDSIIERRKFFADNRIISKADVQEVILGKRNRIVGTDITETAWKFVNSQKFEQYLCWINNEETGEVELVFDMSSVHEKINDTKVLDENGNDIVEQARNEVNSETEHILGKIKEYKAALLAGAQVTDESVREAMKQSIAEKREELKVLKVDVDRLDAEFIQAIGKVTQDSNDNE